MDLFNDKLRTGHYLQPSQLQDDLRIVSRAITAIETQMEEVQESLLAVPTESTMKEVEKRLTERMRGVSRDLMDLSERLEKIENKKSWSEKLWSLLTKTSYRK